jgi:hypothetical protein
MTPDELLRIALDLVDMGAQRGVMLRLLGSLGAAPNEIRGLAGYWAEPTQTSTSWLLSQQVWHPYVPGAGL